MLFVWRYSQSPHCIENNDLFYTVHTYIYSRFQLYDNGDPTTSLRNKYFLKMFRLYMVVRIPTIRVLYLTCVQCFYRIPRYRPYRQYALANACFKPRRSSHEYSPGCRISWPGINTKRANDDAGVTAWRHDVDDFRRLWANSDVYLERQPHY